MGRAVLFGMRTALTVSLWFVMCSNERIANEVPGEQHGRRLREAALCGGLIPHLALYSQVRNILAKGVQRTALDFHKAMGDIDYGLCKGQAMPFTREKIEEDYNKAHAKDEPIIDVVVADDGEIIDLADDPPISADPDIEKYLRSVLRSGSLFTKARMMMAAALGFTNLPWRLLNAIHAFQNNRLCVLYISDSIMMDMYASNGERAASERTIRRDKERLWKAQAKIGVELVWYKSGYKIPGETEKDDQYIPSKYKSNLDRWALEAIYKALWQNRNGMFYVRRKELPAACQEIAKDIPRCPFDFEATKKKNRRRDIDPAILGERIQLKAEASLDHLTIRFHEAWDILDLTLGERDIRSRAELWRLGKGLFTKADVSTATGNRKQRKRSEAEVNQIVGKLVSDIADHYSPAKGRVSNASATLRTVNRVADTNGSNGHHSNGQNGAKNPHLLPAKMTAKGNQYTNREESTPYRENAPDMGDQLENDELTAMLREISARREAIRERFKIIKPDPERLFVKPEYSDEIIRLAEELADLDRREMEKELLSSDPLVAALIEDEMEAIL